MQRLNTKDALKLCCIAIGNDKNSIESELESGVSEAWQVDKVVFITRIEQNDRGKELVIVCSQGKNLAGAAKKLKIVAKKSGCNSARYHTSRPAQQRLLKDFNFVELERVYIADI